MHLNIEKHIKSIFIDDLDEEFKFIKNAAQ